MVALVTVAPIARGVWLAATDRGAAETIASVVSGGTVPVTMLATWAAALAAGTFRGPVVLPPVLAHALATAPLSQWRAFRMRILAPCLIAAVGGAACAAVLCCAWSALGELMPIGAISAVTAGLAWGAIAGALWFAGQIASARQLTTACGALVSAALLVVSVSLSSSGATGKIAATLLTSPVTAATLAAVAILMVCYIRPLSSRLDPCTVITQSLKWETATAHAGTLDLSASATTYQPLPRSGRHIFAIADQAGFLRVIVRRDAVAAARTPARLMAAILALLAAGALIAAAATSVPELSALGAVAGMLTFVAAGALTDGLRHVIDGSSAIPLYGVSELRLLAAHGMFPLLAATVTVAIGVALVAMLRSLDFTAGLLPALLTAAGAIMLRLMSALKPPLPIALLAPLPTPAGDLSALSRLVWAFDAMLLAAVVGIAAPLATLAPAAIVITMLLIAAITARRWRQL
jgi:hypothetical protein